MGGAEIAFEAALQDLEQTVKALETGNLSLDDALKYFEQGVKLARICNYHLEVVEKKIDLLITGDDGSIKLSNAESFEDGES